MRIGGRPKREEVVAHLDGMSREDAEAVDRAAQAMWKADGGDERMGWERLDTRSRMRWNGLALAAGRAACGTQQAALCSLQAAGKVARQSSKSPIERRPDGVPAAAHA